MTDHTPYRINRSSTESEMYNVLDKNGNIVSAYQPKCLAEFIVTACNAHKGLVEGLETLMKGIYDFADVSLEVKNFVYSTATKALAEERS